MWRGSVTHYQAKLRSSTIICRTYFTACQQAFRPTNRELFIQDLGQPFVHVNEFSSFMCAGHADAPNCRRAGPGYLTRSGGAAAGPREGDERAARQGRKGCQTRIT